MPPVHSVPTQPALPVTADRIPPPPDHHLPQHHHPHHPHHHPHPQIPHLQQQQHQHQHHQQPQPHHQHQQHHQHHQHLHQPHLTSNPAPPAFATSPPNSAPPATSTANNPTPHSVSPVSTPRCEGCGAPHPGTYGSGRFCSATCAKKVGARHKWAARASALPGAPRRPAVPRRPSPDAPCECCAKLHDKSYGSGRFCSVHCARRVAATRKWEKSRNEKSKRLEAIRPAMLAPPPPTHQCAVPLWTGKRRRVLGTQLERLHISDSPPSFYVPQPYLPQPLNLPTTTPPPPVCSTPPLRSSTPTPISATLSPPLHHASYLPPQSALPNHTVRYSQSIGQLPHTVDVPFIAPHVVYAHPHHRPNTAPIAPVPSSTRAPLCFAFPPVPAYSVHPSNPTSTPDTVPYSTRSSCSSSMPSPCTQPVTPIPVPSIARPPTYIVTRGPAFDTDSTTANASPARIDHSANSVCNPPPLSAPPRQKIRVSAAPHSRPEKPVENSETAARALLCLRKTNGSDT